MTPETDADHRVVQPASTFSSVPVTKRDSSDARNSTALDMSTGSTHATGKGCKALKVSVACSRVEIPCPGGTGGRRRR